MTSIRQSSTRLELLLTGLLCWSWVQAEPPKEPQNEPQSGALRDGRHDFDFEVGRWKAHVKTLRHRLAHASDWEEFEGIESTRTLPALDGWNESELQVTSTTPDKHVSILFAVRLYNPSTHQWSIYGCSIKSGVFDPPLVGQFNNGRGEFYSQDKWEGRAVFVRFIWNSIDANHARLEQAFSEDGGRTWETNWIYEGERLLE
jgi:hypothetical protein